jgi:hypothetical protein
MIQVSDPTAQRLVNSLTKQREEALDALAIAHVTLAERDATIAELQAKLSPPPDAPKQS